MCVCARSDLITISAAAKIVADEPVAKEISKVEAEEAAQEAEEEMADMVLEGAQKALVRRATAYPHPL